MTEAVALGGVTPTASSFLLEVDGVPIGAFRALSGLELTVSVEEYEEGGVNGFTHRFPGRMTWPNLVFSRGLTDSDALFAWVRRSAGE
ncbi:MAG: hypothetical protein QG597_3664, partial [Actinomycetota bacterium]|nr:hypothetical protein [Actinomycetota bacterium]